MNNTADIQERYSRQLILEDFGEAGQQALLNAKVLMVGAGGLGCAALQYLVAAGVGAIGIIDDDVVSLSNLHRQTLYSTGDIGLPKALKAKQKLHLLNPGINIIAYNERLTTNNALQIFEAYDIIIDGTDNFAARYLINDACVLANKPLVYGAVSQFEGQVAVFNYKKNKENISVNYRDLFPLPPEEDSILNCAEAGVLGVLPGIIGVMQANETIKLITGIGKALVNTILTYDALSNRMYEIELSVNKNSKSLIPADATAFAKMKYEQLCKTVPGGIEIDTKMFDRLIKSHRTSVIDVREYDEVPVVNDFANSRVPLSELRKKMDAIKNEDIILFCQTGKRSLQAAKLLHDTFGTTKNVYSLKGGIIQWLKEHQS